MYITTDKMSGGSLDRFSDFIENTEMCDGDQGSTPNK